MTTPRSRFAAFVLTASLALAPTVPAVPAATANYALGDIATEEIVTPVPLLVVNAQATDALKQNISKQVPFIVRHSPRAVDEVEVSLRNTLALARKNFLDRLQEGLLGRAPTDADIGSPAYTTALAQVAREVPKDFPFDKLTPLWTRAASDAPFVKSLLDPIREVMSQVIVDSKSGSPLPARQAIRLVEVKQLTMPPGLRDLDTPGPAISGSKITSLWRARRLVETSFPAGEQSLGKFAASFVRANALPDPEATEILRARRLDGVTANDSYDAAEPIVRKGQVIDSKALAALAALREKSLIGTLQNQLQQERATAAASTTPPARDSLALVPIMIGGLGGVFLLLLGILWKLRTRPTTLSPAPIALLPAGTAPPQAALPENAGDAAWQQRALQAEARAGRAHEAIRAGVLGWMKEKLVRTLSRQRTDLLTAQQKAEAEMNELEQRLEKLHTPLRERMLAYEKRIEELERDLANKGEANRHLIDARISAARQQLAKRARFDGAN